MQETQVLEAEQARLKDEIEAFQKEKNELEFILDTHRTHCGPSTVGNRPRSDAMATHSVSAVVTVDRSSSANVNTGDTTSLPAMGDGHFPDRGSLSTVAETAVVVSSTPSVTAAPLLPAVISVSPAVGVGGRPTSLPVLSAGRTVGITASGMNLLGLDSLADGHTGLTPLTGIPSGPVVVVGMPLAMSSASTTDTSTVVGYL